jgi:hypothetical protein
MQDAKLLQEYYFLCFLQSLRAYQFSLKLKKVGLKRRFSVMFDME